MKTKSPVAVLLALFIAIGAMAISHTASAQCVNDNLGNAFCPPPGGGCVKEAFGKVKCSAADGGIVLNRFQEAVCGPGQCVMNALGEIFCSKLPKGYATMNATGEPVCSGGCMPGSASACATPTK
jgi:hypothetical protein